MSRGINPKCPTELSSFSLSLPLSSAPSSHHHDCRHRGTVLPPSPSYTMWWPMCVLWCLPLQLTVRFVRFIWCCRWLSLFPLLNGISQNKCTLDYLFILLSINTFSLNLVSCPTSFMAKAVPHCILCPWISSQMQSSGSLRAVSSSPLPFPRTWKEGVSRWEVNAHCAIFPVRVQARAWQRLCGWGQWHCTLLFSTQATDLQGRPPRKDRVLRAPPVSWPRIQFLLRVQKRVSVDRPLCCKMLLACGMVSFQRDSGSVLQTRKGWGTWPGFPLPSSLNSSATEQLTKNQRFHQSEHLISPLSKVGLGKGPWDRGDMRKPSWCLMLGCNPVPQGPQVWGPIPINWEWLASPAYFIVLFWLHTWSGSKMFAAQLERS